jgi:hypothetical protein
VTLHKLHSPTPPDMVFNRKLSTRATQPKGQQWSASR